MVSQLDEMKFFKDPSGIKLWIERQNNQMWVHVKGLTFPFKKEKQSLRKKVKEDSYVENLKAPFPGRIVSINVKENEWAAARQHLIVIESMKMEHTLNIPHKAQIQSIKVKEGQSVEFDEVLIHFSNIKNGPANEKN